MREPSRCSSCGIVEDIALLDGVLDEADQDTGRLACIRCYPAVGGDPEWAPGCDIRSSLDTCNQELRPMYEAWIGVHQEGGRR